MSKNLISEMAHDAYEQWLKCKTAKGSDFEKEAARLDSACKAGQIIKDMADIQLKQLNLTGFLPDDNVLIDTSETKLVNAKRNLAPASKPKAFLDEFTKQ